MTSPRPCPPSLPFAHHTVPIRRKTWAPRSPGFSIPLTSVTITTSNDLPHGSHDPDDTHEPLSHYPNQSIPPPIPPLSPPRMAPKRLDADPLDQKTSPEMASEQWTSQGLVDELRATLTSKTYERYGPVRPVLRDGVGGHWRSYSTPPPSTGAAGGAESECGEWQGHHRVMSEGSDHSAPLRPRGDLPDLVEHSSESSAARRASAPPPSLHVIHPSISTTPEAPSIYPPRRGSAHTLHHTYGDIETNGDASHLAAAVDTIEAGQASASEMPGDDAVYMTQRSAEGRHQTTRRNRVGPGGIISKIASKSSLAKLKIAFLPPKSHPDHLHPTRSSKISQRQPSPSSNAKRESGASHNSHRPAPPPPLLLNSTPSRFAPSSARAPSPSPSATPAPSRAPTPLSIKSYAGNGGPMNGVSPGRSSVWLTEEGMIEIPRFKKRELNLGIVAGGMGQRIAWGVLWAGWIATGLSSMVSCQVHVLNNELIRQFFDVNVLYMLVQCAQNPSSDPNSTSARTWIFAIAAYSICWLISTFGVWIGWEICFEFWRRWRMPRPAIEPVHTSLPATLHLSLTSFRHFTFLVYVRLSPLRTPHAGDIIPETAHLVVQTVPSLAPILPRASLAAVLLVAFSSGDSGTSRRDAAFWVPDSGRLTTYSQAVLLAFVSLASLRILLVFISALALWVFSRPRRPRPSRFRSRFDSFSTTSPTDTRPATPDAATRPRDPAETQSPSKGWIAEADLKWEWRERGRNRLQDAFELCMIRRPRSSAGPSSVQRSRQGSPSRQGGRSVPLGRISRREEENKENEEGEETIISPTSADPFMRLGPSPSRSTIRFASPITRNETDDTIRAAQARPESELEPICTPTQPSRVPPDVADRHSSSASLDPRSALGGLVAARQSASSQDLFYTPMSRPPATERTSSHAELRGKASASTFKGASATPTPTPPSAYRRPANPGPGPSTAGTSLTTLNALGGPIIRDEKRDEMVEGNRLGDGLEDGGGTGSDRQQEAGLPFPSSRPSTDTTSGESITDDSAALLSRSSSLSGHTPPTSSSSSHHPSHPKGHARTASDSLRRASILFRERSQSLVSRFRDRSGSINGAAGGSDEGHVGSMSSSKRGSYATLRDPKGDGGMSEFGMNGTGAKLGRDRSVSVGLRREAASGLRDRRSEREGGDEAI